LPLRPPLSISGESVIVVDDRGATRTTMKVAVRALERWSPHEIIVAPPVAPPETVSELAQKADQVICLNQPAHFQEAK
jgi:putative phosphoribosyl transferase